MLDILKGLNPQQKEAVIYTGSPLLLLAGAGSGKTRVLTHRAAYFIQQNLANPAEILLLTFTNKAAGEMKERMAKLLPQTSSLKSNNLFAGTFHSFCCRVLRIDGDKIGIGHNFNIYDSNDQQDLVKRILIEMDLSPKEFKPSSVMYYIENAKNNFKNPQLCQDLASGFWEDYAAKIYKKYQKKLEEFNALDFNDLLFRTVELLENVPSCLDKYNNKFKYIFIDEYQDTNQVQYRLSKLLAQKDKQITAVGDACQAIYGWRGADYKNLENFQKDFTNTKIINLEENYRSTQNILSAANKIIAKNTSHPILNLFTSKTSQEKIKAYEAQNEVDEAEHVAQQIDFYFRNLNIPYKNIAVLYRMNAQSRVLEEAFLKHTIPYVLLGGTRFYERAEIKDIISMVRFACDQRDKISETRIIKTLGKRRSKVFFENIDSISLKQKTSDILNQLLDISGYMSKFNLKDEDHQKKIENIKELNSVATTYPKVQDFLENIALVEQEYSLQEKNKKKEKKEGVRLMTLHGSKGLEFEVVFLVGLEEGILPHLRCIVDEKEIEEERRLCYVGVTRAKDFLHITYASKRLYFGKSSLNEPSRFLADIPQNLIEHDRSGFISFSKNKNQDIDDDFIYDNDIY
jgi:DNA helicase II / ATP-dependent DNA helicase PcrA